jgi:hypothetical protein
LSMAAICMNYVVKHRRQKKIVCKNVDVFSRINVFPIEILYEFLIQILFRKAFTISIVMYTELSGIH